MSAPTEVASLTDAELIERMFALDWRPAQEEYNRRAVKNYDLWLSLVERRDPREREKLKEWGPGNWRDAKPVGPNTIIDHERAQIIGDALERLSSTGYEGVGEIAPNLRDAANAQQFSEMMISTLDPYTLAKRAINTSRINYRNKKQRERDHSINLGDGTGFVPDNSANTENDAFWEMAASTLTELERGLCSLLLQGHSLRDIESGTAKAGWKVGRRELARMLRGIEKKLRASGVTPDSAWRPQLPHHPTFNPGGRIREKPKKNADEQAEQSRSRSMYDDQDCIAQMAQWARNRMLDRDARRRGPATEAELQECRDAMAAVDARVGSDDVDTAHERVVRGALVEYRDLLAKIERSVVPSGRFASAEREDDA